MLQLGTFIALALRSRHQRGAALQASRRREAPVVELRRPLRSAAGLFGSRWWTIGFAIATGAWALHVVALAIAPLSLVETTISGGLILLAWLAERWFGARLGSREWLGLGLCAGGLALLAATSGHAGSPNSAYQTGAMIPFEATAIGAGRPPARLRQLGRLTAFQRPPARRARPGCCSGSQTSRSRR